MYINNFVPRKFDSWPRDSDFTRICGKRDDVIKYIELLQEKKRNQHAENILKELREIESNQIISKMLSYAVTKEDLKNANGLEIVSYCVGNINYYEDTSVDALYLKYDSDKINTFSVNLSYPSLRIRETPSEYNWLKLITDGYSWEGNVEITLKDGKLLTYILKENAKTKYEKILKEKLSIGNIAKLCLPLRTKTEDAIAFYKGFVEEIGLIDNIKKISIRSTYKTTNFSRLIDSNAENEYFVNSNMLETISDELYFETGNHVKTRETKAVLYDKNDKKSEIIVDSTKDSKTLEINELFDFLVMKDNELFFCYTNESNLTLLEKNNKKRITSIGAYAFCTCGNLEELIIPKNIIHLVENTFDGCNKLKSVSYEEGLNDIEVVDDGSLLCVWSNNKEYTIDQGVDIIEERAFESCNRIHTLILNKNYEFTATALSGSSINTIVINDDCSNFDFGCIKNTKVKYIILNESEKIDVSCFIVTKCFEEQDGKLVFSYRKLANIIDKITKTDVAVKYAFELLENHKDVADDKCSDLADLIITASIPKNDFEMINKLFSLDYKYVLDFQRYIDIAKRNSKQEMLTILLDKSSQVEERKQLYEKEIPCVASNTKSCVRVKFENGKSYTYLCPFEVKVGCTAYVAGKMAGVKGKIIETDLPIPTGRAALYAQSITSAYNVEFFEFDSDLEL